MDNNTYTLEVDRSKPIDAINEIKRRSHQDVINEYLRNVPEPIGGIRYINRGIISEIGRMFGYSSGGVVKILERAGLYRNGVVPASCNIKQHINQLKQ